MTTIKTILDKYRSGMDSLDLELIIAHELKQSREFVLMYPEKTVSRKQETAIGKLLRRRVANEPIAYLLGHKEFYGIDFKVTKDTLIPRPETELLVDLAIKAIEDAADNKLSIIDVGTGSGNIIISIAKMMEHKNLLHTSCLPANKACYTLYGIDLSEKALRIAKRNAKNNKLDKKIKFLKGNLLKPILQNTKYKIQNTRYLILANLPYLSKKIYSETAPTVKNFEPKSALYSPRAGLDHYEKLLKQIKILNAKYKILSAIIEISPEQKKALALLIKKNIPSAKVEFHKDLANRWRICKVNLS